MEAAGGAARLGRVVRLRQDGAAGAARRTLILTLTLLTLTLTLNLTLTLTLPLTLTLTLTLTPPSLSKIDIPASLVDGVVLASQEP